MRSPVDEVRLRAVMKALAARARDQGRVYVTGGASAVLEGWRPSTIDIDLKIIPENDRLLRALSEIKESLEVNIELAAPSDFVPELPGWEGRSRFIAREGPLSFYQYDFYTQALSKLERRHRKDLEDVRSMVRAGLVDPAKLRALFSEVEDQLYRYPAIDPRSLRQAVEELEAAG